MENKIVKEMNKKIKIAISSVIGVVLLGAASYAVYALTHKEEEDKSSTATAVMEQTIVEVDTVVLRKQTFQKQINSISLSSLRQTLKVSVQRSVCTFAWPV